MFPTETTHLADEKNHLLHFEPEWGELGHCTSESTIEIVQQSLGILTAFTVKAAPSYLQLNLHLLHFEPERGEIGHCTSEPTIEIVQESLDILPNKLSR